MGKHSDTEVDRSLPLRRRVSRIAQRLAGTPLDAPESGTEDFVRGVIHARRLRFHFLPANLMGEPAWDILLELMLARIERRAVTVTALSEAGGIPGSVTWRWLNLLISQGLVRRQPDPQDPVTELFELEPMAVEAMKQYFDELSDDS